MSCRPRIREHKGNQSPPVQSTLASAPPAPGRWGLAAHANPAPTSTAFAALAATPVVGGVRDQLSLVGLAVAGPDGFDDVALMLELVGVGGLPAVRRLEEPGVRQVSGPFYEAKHHIGSQRH
eukprot:CAMPEP_0181471720 /NCGR_PEP_ID=MMETSP1110-20121109/39222_1 /TAXON_ID=174948 /ORGANISM="Symbiodinium sp., Strain CCMP421" /LENGTH=121 /DNA_ID=CAMNT_0023596751 /DNA_START=218 /DNA_END=584 /DNA_ORIENTATION=-